MTSVSMTVITAAGAFLWGLSIDSPGDRRIARLVGVFFVGFGVSYMTTVAALTGVAS